MRKLNRARVLTVEQLEEIRYPLPRGWAEAAGLLTGKNIDGVRYQRRVRSDWEKRLKKLEAQLHHAKRVKKVDARLRDAR